VEAETPGRPIRLWMFLNTPAPYQVDLLRGLEESGLFAVSARFMGGVHRGTVPSGTAALRDGRVLRGWGPHWWSDAFRIHPEAWREVARGEHDIYVLSGQYTSLTFARLARELGRCGRRWVVWLERPWPAEFRPPWTRSVAARSAVVRALRQWYLQGLLRRTDAVLAIGSRAVETYHNLSGGRTAVYNFPYVCDVRRFQVPDAARRRQELRARLGIGRESVLYLFCGQLIERKGLRVLFGAFARLARDDSVLLVVGDGPLRGKLSVPPRTILAGAVAYERIPDYFLAADVFVFPTLYDGWGVVVNEACAAGLPLICSRAAGAAWDLVTDGENGFLVEAGDEAELASAMARLAVDAELRTVMGERARRRVQEFTVQRAAEKLYRICAALC